MNSREHPTIYECYVPPANGAPSGAPPASAPPANSPPASAPPVTGTDDVLFEPKGMRL